MNQLSNIVLILVIPLFLYSGYEIHRLQNKLERVKAHSVEPLTSRQIRETNNDERSDGHPIFTEVTHTSGGEKGLRTPGIRNQLHNNEAIHVDKYSASSFPSENTKGQVLEANRLQTALHLVDRFAFDELNDEEFVTNFDALIYELDRTELELVLTAYTEYLEAGSLRSDPLFGAVDN